LPGGYPTPPENTPSVYQYARARMKGEAISNALYRDVIAGPWVAAMYWPYRWFWKSSAFLPDWLFDMSFNFAYGKGLGKQTISRIVQWLRAERAIAWKTPTEAKEK